MKKSCIHISTLSFLIAALLRSAGASAASMPGEKPLFQLVRAELYRFERQDSCMVLDMNIDLTNVRLTPDCTVFLYPHLYNGNDSLILSPVMLNGPQSDLMYRRHRTLGTYTAPGNREPYVVLRQSEHRLPTINYRTEVPYAGWMGQAQIGLRIENCNCDERLLPFVVSLEKKPPVVIEKVVEKIITDTLLIRDTIRIASEPAPYGLTAGEPGARPAVRTAPVYRESEPIVNTRPVHTPAGTVTPDAGNVEAVVYFSSGDTEIRQAQGLNRNAWAAFAAQVEAARSAAQRGVRVKITVTGYSSPEDAYLSNDSLARARAKAVKRYLETKFAPGQAVIRTERVAEHWDGLVRLVRTSGMPEKERILKVIDRVGIFEGRETKLKEIDGGRAWARMLEAYFPELRCAVCRIEYTEKPAAGYRNNAASRQTSKRNE